MRILRTFRWHYDVAVALRYTRVVDDQLLLVTRLCEHFFCTKNTFLTVSVIRKLAIIKKEEYLLLLFTRPLPRDGGMAEDHGALGAGPLPRVWTRGRKEIDSRQRVSGAKSP